MISNLLIFFASVFNLPFDSIQSSISFYLTGIYYWKGLIPVSDVLNFFGYVLTWMTVIFSINAAEWMYHKIPFLGH